MEYRLLKNLGIDGQVHKAGSIIVDSKIGEMFVSMGVATRTNRDIESFTPKIEIEPERPLKIKTTRCKNVRKR